MWKACVLQGVTERGKNKKSKHTKKQKKQEIYKVGLVFHIKTVISKNKTSTAHVGANSVRPFFGGITKTKSK